MSKIIAFVNQKGGVGKTTTCVNVSSFMAEMGKKVLLVDLDPQGNASTGLGIEKNKETKTIYNVIDGECFAAEIVQKTCVKGLDIIPATVELAGAEVELVQMDGRESIVKGILDELIDSYDVITIDCPPSLGLLTVNSLTAANSVLIPFQCEFFPLEGLTQLMNTIKLVKKHLNADLEIEGVVFTMKNSKSVLVNQVSNEIIKFFGKKVYDTYIPRNVRLAEAPSHGLPINLYDPRSPGAKAYKQLTDEVLARINTWEQEKKKEK